MADPAIVQIKDAIKALLTVTSGPSIFVDRDDAEPIQPEERPARVIRSPDVTLDERMENIGTVQMHVATIEIDHYEDSNATDNLDKQLAIAVAETVALIGTNPTFDQKVFELTMVSADASADNVPDAGVAVLTFQIKFQTLLYDWTTIVF